MPMNPGNVRRDLLKSIAKKSILISATGILSACFYGKPAFVGIDLSGADCAQGFQLSGHNGQVRTLQDFAGKVVVVFLGTPSALMSAPRRWLNWQGPKSCWVRKATDDKARLSASTRSVTPLS